MKFSLELARIENGWIVNDGKSVVFYEKLNSILDNIKIAINERNHISQGKEGYIGSKMILTFELKAVENEQKEKLH